MRCPYCQTPAAETLATCGRCGFSLERVERYYGRPPLISHGVTDLADVLRRASIRSLNDSLVDFHQTFPQCHMAVVTTRLEADQPLNAWAFWLLNSSGLVPQMEKGSDCRWVILAVDVAIKRAALVVGYGLEPLINQSVLDDCLKAAELQFRKEDWADAIGTVIKKTGEALIQVATEINRIYGLPEEGGVAPGPSAEIASY